MSKARFGFVVLALGTLLATAPAQYGYGEQFSEISWQTTTSDPSVTVSYVGSVDYTNGVSAVATGNSANYSYPDQSTAGPVYDSIANFSEDTEPFFAGYASQFEGIDSFIDITNTSGAEQQFTFQTNLYETNSIEGNAVSVAYGGFQEYGGADVSGYNTVVLDSDGTIYDDPENYDNSDEVDNYYPIGYQYADSEAYSYSAFTDTLMPGETIEVQIWTSGFTSVNSSAAVPSLSGEYQPVPEPFTITLSMAGIGMAVHRRVRKPS